MKKTNILTLLAILIASSVFAQQVPMYSHYYFNRFMYNPAITGLEDYGQAFLIYRDQWNQIPDAPTTKALTIDGPLKNKAVGIGVSLFRDNAAQFNTTGGQIAYRYGLKLAKDHILNLGLSLGFLDNRIDWAGIMAKHPTDPVILTQAAPKTGFDATFGMHYSFKKLGIGFSVPQVLGNSLRYDNVGDPTIEWNINYGLVRHFIGTLRYSFDLNEEIKFEPIAMVRAIPGAPLQYDVNAMFNYKDLFWLGGMYRSQYSATVSTAVALAQQFILGYSYDIAVHSNRQYTRGANEVMIGYRFGGSPSEDPDIKKRFEKVEERVKKNEDDIKDVQDKNKEQDEKLDKIEKDVDDVKKDVEKLKGDFDDFKTSLKKKEIEVGSSFSFKNVFFDTDKSNIRGVDVSELKNLAQILAENPTMRISVIGHADKRGTREYNMRLSRRRAEAVRDYLVSQGISRDRLEIGYESFDDPASNNLDDNRRVEFTVLSK